MNVYKCRQWDNPISEFSYTVFLQAHIYFNFLFNSLSVNYAQHVYIHVYICSTCVYTKSLPLHEIQPVECSEEIISYGQC